MSAPAQISWDEQPKTQQATAQVSWDDEQPKRKPEKSFLQKFIASTPVGKVAEVAGQVGDIAQEKAQRNEAENLSAAAKGQKAPHSGIVNWALRSAGRLGQMDRAAADPLNLGIAGAATVLPEIAGPAMVAHGGAGMWEHARAIKDLVTTGQANPDELEGFLGSGAEATGGTAMGAASLRPGAPPTMTRQILRAGGRAAADVIEGRPPSFKVPEAAKALTQAVQPGVNIPRAQESIPIAGRRIQQLRQAGQLTKADGTPLTEIKSTGDQLDAITSAKRYVWSAIEQRMGPVAELQADTAPVAEAMEKSVSRRTAQQFPQVAEGIKNRAASYRSTMPLKDIEEAIQDANNDLRNFYKRPNVSDSPEAPHMKATQAEVQALREMLDQKVEQLGGEGVKDLKREYGALRDLERATAKQHAVATRTKGGGLWEGLSYLHAAGDLMSGNLLGAAKGGVALTVGRMLRTLRDPSFLIEQSYHGPKAFQAADAIGRSSGPPAPKGLLPSPPTEMGAGEQADTSGPTRGGRYTTPAALLPEEKAIVPKFIREFRANQSETATAKTSVKGALPERAGQLPESNIPPMVDPKFVREVIGRAGDPNQLGARGEGGVRVPPRTRLTGVAESTVPEEARLLMRQTLDMMRSGDRPGRYFDQAEYGDVRLRSRGAQTKGGDWRGVKSMRNMLEWANENEFTPTEMEAGIQALEEGRTNNRVAQSAMEFIQRANKPRMREPGED